MYVQVLKYRQGTFGSRRIMGGCWGGGGGKEDMLRRVVRWEVTAANRFETLIQLVSSQARSQPATSTLRTSLGRTLISHLRVAPRISQRLTTRQSATGLAGKGSRGTVRREYLGGGGHPQIGPVLSCWVPAAGTDCSVGCPHWAPVRPRRVISHSQRSMACMNDSKYPSHPSWPASVFEGSYPGSSACPI